MSTIRPFYINDLSAIINLTVNFCDTELKVLQSEGFNRVLTRFLGSITKKSPKELYQVKKTFKEKDLIEIYTSLLVFSYEDVLLKHKALAEKLKYRRELYLFSERLYDFWRRFKRYGVIQKNNLSLNLENESLVGSADKLSRMILSLYRTVTQNLLGENFKVYRQAPAGVNATILLRSNKWVYPKGYECLESINFIDTVVIRTPFMGYSKANTRAGFFTEIKTNPLNKLQLTPRHWICFPVKVGPLIAFVYFHRDFLHHGVALSNLFQPAHESEYLGKNPNLIYVFGVTNSEFDCSFYHDNDNDIYIGIAKREDKNDYFGYMKKMLLTLHNVYMINHKKLPIHGAMVKITLRNDVEKNIVIIGDSGAGKSETLEALRVIGDQYIKEMIVIFDDMGTFYEVNGKIIALGTEIGAFIRLDDLENGYAYREIDRAFFLNPDKVNARVILPVTDYYAINTEQAVDMVLYANNYEEEKDGCFFFDDVDTALEIFRQGARKAKGTTNEVGLVLSYFANPFGPVQRQEETDKLLVKVFKKLFDTKIPVGEIYTKLAVDGYELKGPQEAAKILLEMLLKGKKK